MEIVFGFFFGDLAGGGLRVKFLLFPLQQHDGGGKASGRGGDRLLLCVSEGHQMVRNTFFAFFGGWGREGRLDGRRIIKSRS